jgi:hypothetical protein
LIRQPGRLRIRWEGDATLLIEFDAGAQTRRLNFASSPAQATSTRQGQSVAKWFRQPQNRDIFGRGGATTGGSLEVVTTNLLPGYLRPNGVPYSGRTVVKEFLDSFTLPEDGTWLIVTTVVNDPEYLTQESSSARSSKRNPTPRNGVRDRARSLRPSWSGASLLRSERAAKERGNGSSHVSPDDDRCRRRGMGSKHR